jgi:hypothetical protein
MARSKKARGQAERAERGGGRDARVSEVEAGLEEARHFGLAEEVVDGVQEDVAGGGARGEEGHPLLGVLAVVWFTGWCGVSGGSAVV